MNCSKNTQNYWRVMGTLRSQTAVDIRLIGEDDIGEVISLTPRLSLINCEVSSGRVNYTGKLVLTVVYVSSEGKLCRMQKGVEFSHYVDDKRLAPANVAQCKLKCVQSKIRREGSEQVCALIIDAEITVFCEAERNVVLSAEGVECLVDNIEFYSLTPFVGESLLEDDFTATDVQDILSDSASIIIYKCNADSGEVFLEGDLHLKLMGLRGDTPVFLERSVPFKCAIESGDISSEGCASCYGEVSNLSVQATVSDDGSKCKINVEATLSFFGYALKKNSQPAVIDAYICANECAISTQKEVFKVLDDVKTLSSQVAGVCATSSAIDYSCTFKAIVEPRVEYGVSGEQMQGVVYATLIYAKEGELHQTLVSLPFAITDDVFFSADCNTQVCVSGVSVRQKAEGECECEARLNISVNVVKPYEVTFVTQIESGESKNLDEHALSIYFVKAGASQWETAKTLSISVEKLSALLNGVSFPLEKDERIALYRIKGN